MMSQRFSKQKQTFPWHYSILLFHFQEQGPNFERIFLKISRGLPIRFADQGEPEVGVTTRGTQGSQIDEKFLTSSRSSSRLENGG